MFYDFQRQARKRKLKQMILEDQIVNSQATSIASALVNQKQRKQQGPDESRVNNYWEQGYHSWMFKDNFRVSRETFEFILVEVEGYLIKKTNE